MLIIYIILVLVVLGHSFPVRLSSKPRNLISNMRRSSAEKGFTAAMIVPTGVGATIGGYAGDALPAVKLLSNVVDNLITHPNVMNAAMLYWPLPNVLYVEGSSLDSFAEGRVALSPMTKGAHRIGLLLDRGIESDLRTRHLHVANAMRASLGIDVAHCAVTSRNVNVQLEISKASGASWGSIGDTETLVEGARWLVEQKGCTAVAVVVRFPEDNDIEDTHNGLTAAESFNEYRSGQGVDGIAGAEALISHVIGKALNVPCAHAPAFSPMEPDASVSPKACAEELGYTFLPCVLAYLHRAPRILPLSLPQPQLTPSSVSKSKSAGDRDRCSPAGLPGLSSGCVITRDDVDAVVAPHNALGGAAVLQFLSRGVPVIAVQDNHTTMRVSAEQLHPQPQPQAPSAEQRQFSGSHQGGGGTAAGPTLETAAGAQASRAGQGRILHARSYAEAAGMLVALKHGILLEAVTPHVPPIAVTEL